MKLFGYTLYKTSLLLVVVFALVAAPVQCMNQAASIDKAEDKADSDILKYLKMLPGELKNQIFFLSLGATLGYNFTFSKALNAIPSATQALALSPDGATIIAGSGDKIAYILDAKTGHVVLSLKGHTGSISSVAYSPDGKTVLTGSYDKTARLWCSKSGKLLKTFEGNTPILSVTFSPTTSEIVLIGGDNSLAYLWNSTSGKLLLTLTGHTCSVDAVAISPDGKTLLTGSSKTAHLWDTETGKELRVLQRNKNSTCLIDYSYEESVASLMDFPQSSTIKSRGELEKLLDPFTRIMSVAFSPDGETILTGYDDWTASLWSTTTGKQLRVLEGHRGGISSVAFSSDGSTLLTGSVDSTACLWDAKTGIPLKTLRKHTESLHCAFFSPDGKAIFTCSLDKSLFIWNYSEDSHEWTLTRRLSGLEHYVKMLKLLTLKPNKNLFVRDNDNCLLF